MTEKKEITITRALTELKTIGERIEKVTNNLVPVFVVQAKKKINNHIEPEAYEKSVRADYQSVTDLMTRRNNIKIAIVESNAKTPITINGVGMTVAEALTQKESIKYKKSLRDRFKSHYNSAVALLERNTINVEQEIEKNLLALYGSEKDVKANVTEEMRQQTLKNKEWKLANPLNIKEEIEKLDKEIEGFESEIDFTLSESNAQTKILV